MAKCFIMRVDKHLEEKKCFNCEKTYSMHFSTQDVQFSVRGRFGPFRFAPMYQIKSKLFLLQIACISIPFGHIYNTCMLIFTNVLYFSFCKKVLRFFYQKTT